MILNLVLKALGKKKTETVNVENSAAPVVSEDVVAPLLQQYELFHKRIQRQKAESEIPKTWVTKASQEMCVFNDGSYVMRNAAGQIIKTRDAMHRVTEYRRDEESGELLVKKFGVWNSLEFGGCLAEDGTLTRKCQDGLMQECLDGTEIHISFSKRSLIARNERSGEEIALNLGGLLRHRHSRDGVELYSVYRDGALEEESEIYETPIRCMIKTMSEDQELINVARIERRYEQGKLISEVYTFLDSKTASRALRICLNLPSGELHLAKVHKVVNHFDAGRLKETTFELSEPVSVTRDSEGNVSLIRGISKVRRFLMHEDVCAVVFVDANGDENLYFPTL
ncbi:MAG: hypothetical protein K2X27_19900 [Candidatus Obscuribacterales bacterium]|nr:hypothetical protein [Candidatus Obscuribacterales bacterium]